jgi:transcriptional regulator with XRE-family HTH domain
MSGKNEEKVQKGAGSENPLSQYTFDTKLLGVKLKEYRKKHDLTIREFAKLLGINYSALYKLEVGDREPQGVQICAILDYLDLPPTIFLLKRSA